MNIKGNSPSVKRKLSVLYREKPEKFKQLVAEPERLRLFAEMINSRDYGSLNSVEVNRLLNDSLALALEVDASEIDESIEMFRDNKKFSADGELSRNSPLTLVNVYRGFDEESE
jgi:hypothetical protein